LNEYILAERTNKFAAAKLKKRIENQIIWECRRQKIKPIQRYPVRLEYFWYPPDKRIDKSNLSFSQKFIEDALQGARILRNDGWSELEDPVHHFTVDAKKPRVEIFITEDLSGEETHDAT